MGVKLGSDLGEEHRLRVFEDRVLKRIFEPKRNEVTVGWRKLHNEDHRKFESSSRAIEMIRPRMTWAGNVARMREKRNAHRSLVGK
jgi:hypothetical protein